MTDCAMDDYNHGFQDRLLDICTSGNSDQLELFCITAWSIWQDRNSTIHKTPVLEGHYKGEWILKYWQDYKRANSISLTDIDIDLAASNVFSSWNPPPLNFCKINTDGAVGGKNKTGSGSGVVLRNTSGILIAASSIYSSVSFSVVVAELIAIKWGLLLAVETSQDLIFIESDSKMALSLIASSSSDLSETGVLVEEIVRLAAMFRSCSFVFTPRSANRVADSLAHLAMEVSTSSRWFSAFPSWLQSLVSRDLIV